MCGIVLGHTLEDAYNMQKTQQSRGREATGFAAIGRRIDVIKWRSNVRNFDIEDLIKIFPGNDYHTYIGHVRYATRGDKNNILCDAHPHVIGGLITDNGDHVIVRDCDSVIVHNGQVAEKYLKGINTSLLTTGCDSESILHYHRKFGSRDILKNIPGAYTMIIAVKNWSDVLILRDRSGIKPGVFGVKDGKYIVASEDNVFIENHGTYIEDLTPGTIYSIPIEGEYSKTSIIKPRLKYCFFEWNYIANVKSTINGVSVRRVREILGEMCAKEFPFKADYVSFLPRCPEVAARQYGKTLGIPFIYTLYKKRGERAFQGSTAKDRKESIDSNLFLLPEAANIIKGKTIVVMDDSTIRGNNQKRLVKLYKQAGVGKIYYINYTPKIGVIGTDGERRGCHWGVDMPPNDRFIVLNLPEKGKTDPDFKVTNRTEAEINAVAGTNVHFLSVDNLLNGFKKAGISRKNLCTYCIGGEKPF